MKRGLIISALLLLTCLCSAGKTRHYDIPRFTYGVEWGYTATVFYRYHNYFIAPEGFRVEDSKNEFLHIPNGEVNIHAGWNLNPDWNLSFHLGYTGISNLHPGIPASVRITRFFGNDYLKDRWFAYGEAGSGISIKENPQELIVGKLGGGYRLSLSKYTKVDFIISARYIQTHQDVNYYGEIIDKANINHNAGHTVSASLGIGLTF